MQSPRALLALAGLLAALVLTGCVAPAPNSWPGVSANAELAFVASNTQVHAIGLNDGKQRWAFPASPGSDLFFAEPGVSEDVIVVGSEGIVGGFHGALFGLNPSNGAQKWCLALDSKARDRLTTAAAPCPLIPGGTEAGPLGIMPPEDNRVIGGITLREGIAYVGLASHQVIAVEAATGKHLWTFSGADHPFWAAPAVTEAGVFVGSLDHSLYALDATGGLRWGGPKDLGGAIGGTPAVAADRLYVGTFNNRLVALNTQDGAEAWSFQATNWVWSGPAVVDEAVYFADLNGVVFAVDATDGRPLWQQTPGGKMRATPAVAGNALYIGDKDGNLFALNRADGTQQWKQPIQGGGQLYASPLVLAEQDLVLVAPYQGSNLLVAYTTGGAFKWAFAPSR